MKRNNTSRDYSLQFLVKESQISYTPDKPKIKQHCTTSKDAIESCLEITNIQREMFIILLLDPQNNITDRILITLGLLNACLIHPREVFRPAILGNAASIILAHNHTTGDPSPSLNDIKVTKQMIRAGKIIKIHVLDHIILGKEEGRINAYSMRERGIIRF